MKTLEKLLRERPGAVGRQGASTFVKTPVYRSKRQYKAVYINAALFHKLLSPKKRLSFHEMAAVIEAGFNITIEKKNAEGKAVGTAYVDRQADPLGLSLSGNGGSGRAWYAGKIFNIKGEKTPLAKSKQKRFSDGYLEMERCLWETLIADGLQGALANGLNAVLAVLDMDETCDVIWRDAPVRRGKIIRVDTSGELDRVTHLFQRKKPLTKAAMMKMAKGFGLLEADKFAERLVHGTWSPGNISPAGHLIDFDTVCATKGRSPQYSSTRWHHQNYFGYEHLGQLLVLEAVAKDKRLNRAGVTYDALKDAMLTAMKCRLEEKFITLMGFDAAPDIRKRFGPEVEELCELWAELARKTYRKMAAFSSKDAQASLLPVFDFSAFFRIYPLQKRAGTFFAEESVFTMADTSLKNRFRDKKEKLTKEEQPYHDAVMEAIGGDFVTSEQELALLKIAALHFVRRYDALHAKIAAATKARMKEVEARAYVVNEDRFYMFPPHTVTFHLAERQQLAPETLDEIMRALVLSCRRDPAGRIADVHLYQQGYSFTELDGKGGYRRGFRFFGDPGLKKGPITLEQGGQSLKLTRKKDNKIIYLSNKCDIGELDASFFRESSLLFKEAKLYSLGVILKLTGLLEKQSVK
ncbi:MAG: hypothetical protein GC185_10880 [Alphaproteobacteria bacterium]|nr:hypothetical protein [Alphaproteobacteria bacterium]